MKEQRRTPACRSTALLLGCLAVTCCVLSWRFMLLGDSGPGEEPARPVGAPMTSRGQNVDPPRYVKFVSDVALAGRSMFDLQLVADRPPSCGNDSLSLPPMSVLYLPGSTESDVSPTFAGDWFVRDGDGPIDVLASINWSAHRAKRQRRRSSFCAQRNAYLGYAVNVDADAVQLLLLSYGRFHTKCDTFVLFTDTTLVDASPEIAMRVEDHRIVLLNATDFLSRDEQALHATLARYFAFRTWMQQIGVRLFDFVVHVDVRDVLFQQNFFAAYYHIAGSGHPEALRGVFSLAEESTFAVQDLSSDWIRDVLPVGQSAALVRRLVLSRIDDMPLPIMNSGIVGGASVAYRDYLVAMTTLVLQLRPAAKSRYGIDQGVHLALFSVGFYACRFPHPALLLSSRVGPARNSFLPPAVVHRDEFGRVLNCNRQPYALLHQMDRFPSLVNDLKLPYRSALRNSNLLPELQLTTSHSMDEQYLPQFAAQGPKAEDDAALDAALFEYLSSARSGAFRYVRCRWAGRDLRQLILIVVCSRGLVLERAEMFLRQLMEQAATCTNVVFVVAGGSGLALANLELDFDGRFDAISTLFAASVDPAVIALQWLRQRLSEDNQIGKGIVVSIALDVNFSTLSASALLPRTSAHRKPNLEIFAGGGIGAQGNIRSVMHALGAVRGGEVSTKNCGVTSPWWNVCWDLVAKRMSRELGVEAHRSAVPIAAWTSKHLRMFQRHPKQGGPLSSGMFVTHFDDWNK